MLRTMSTTIFEFGYIVLVPFPFTNQLSSKRRPAIVISNSRFNQQQRDVVLMAVTSQVRSPVLFGETLVADWSAAGLLKPSVVKPVLMRLEMSLIVRRLGRLTDTDRSALQNLLVQVLGE